MTLRDVYAALTAPFDIGQIELKPGATNKEKTKALALAYCDSRVYQDRLDAVIGPDDWSVEYRPLGEHALMCRLTILGVVREDVGEADANDSNAATVAVAQAFKRACAAFGLGRYLYHLPQLWLPVREAGRSVVFTDVTSGVRQIYREAGLSDAGPEPPADPPEAVAKAEEAFWKTFEGPVGGKDWEKLKLLWRAPLARKPSTLAEWQRAHEFTHKRLSDEAAKHHTVEA